jgi:NTP pyrophosphatase (non-canonical NTP hydrolase)
MSGRHWFTRSPLVITTWLVGMMSVVHAPATNGSYATNVGPYRVLVVQGDTFAPDTRCSAQEHIVWVRTTASTTPRMVAISDHVVAIYCQAGSDTDHLATAPLLGWLAAVHSDLRIVGRLLVDDTGDSCSVTIYPSEHELPDDAQPLVIKGTAVYVDASGPSWLPMRGVHLGRSNQPDAAEDPPAADVLAALTRSGLPALDMHARRHGVAPLAGSLRHQVREAELESMPPLAKAGAELASATAAAPTAGDHRAGEAELRTIQDRCLRLYGRLEPERALAWALEELGELAQAVRRNESTVRMEQELGQVMAWSFCLANILRIDAAQAFGRAYQQEAARQLRKYGSIHPYRR